MKRMNLKMPFQRERAVQEIVKFLLNLCHLSELERQLMVICCQDPGVGVIHPHLFQARHHIMEEAAVAAVEVVVPTGE